MSKDNIELLREYKNLLDEGILTQEEFDAKKTELMSSLGSSPPDTEEADADVSVEMNDADEISSEPQQPVSPSSGFSLSGIPKKVLIGGAAVLLILIIILASGGDKKSSSTTSSSSSGSSSSSESVSDDSYSSDTGSGSSSYSDDGISEMQGMYDLVVIKSEGEETYVQGKNYGTLEISGNRWTIAFYTDETTTFSGTIEHVFTSTDGDRSYIYKFHSEKAGEGYVEAIFVPKNDMVSVSTESDFDMDNMNTYKKRY